jgi:hypothetical protein
MGISIELDPPSAEYPYPIAMTLECDSARDMFCRGFTRYLHQDGYQGCHSMAMADGWLERQAPQGRLWLCPQCSGK